MRSKRPLDTYVHCPTIAKSNPATNDPVHKPESDESDREPHEDEADPKGRHDEHHAKGDPEQAEPERSDLPAKVRFKPGATSLVPLDVVQNDRDDRRPASEKCTDHRSRAEDAGQQAERMKGVYDLCPGDE